MTELNLRDMSRCETNLVPKLSLLFLSAEGESLATLSITVNATVT